MANNIDFSFEITKGMIDSGLKGNELIIFAFLNHQTDMNGVYAKGINELSRVLGVTEPTAHSVVKRLVEYGIVKKDIVRTKDNNTVSYLTVIKNPTEL